MGISELSLTVQSADEEQLVPDGEWGFGSELIPWSFG